MLVMCRETHEFVLLENLKDMIQIVLLHSLEVGIDEKARRILKGKLVSWWKS